MTAAGRARHNPFRVRRVLEQRYRLDAAGWESLLDRFARQRHRAALVGPQGSGKTTLLEDLEGRLAASGWRILRLRLNRERRRLTAAEKGLLQSAGPRHLVTVDGFEQLSWWERRRVASASRAAGGLLVTRHRAGLLPVLHRHRTSPGLLAQLVADLVGDDEAEALQPELDRLFEIHRGNLRDCLRSLYDRWAVLAAVGGR